MNTPGYKTPAFYLTLAATALAALFASGAALPGSVASSGAVLLAALGSAGYASVRAFVKGADGKPAWKTTEFWLSLSAVVVGALLGSGAFTDASSGAKLLGYLASALGALGYAVRFSLPPRA
jgi:hypothetical protein